MTAIIVLANLLKRLAINRLKRHGHHWTVKTDAAFEGLNRFLAFVERMGSTR